MIFSILVILIVLGVTYMNYLQGAFTAAISLGCALAATLVAFGYYEDVVNLLAQGGFADYAGGASMILLFTITFAVLRVAADALVPGNIGLQLYVEKAGAVVFGFLAGLLAAGTFATAVQMMPMGPAVAGYARYEVRDRDVQVPTSLTGKLRAQDTFVTNEVVPDRFDSSVAPAGLLLPADGIVQDIVKLASAGSFSGGQSFAIVHPDLATETFATRLGPDTSGKHVVLNTAKQTNATVDGLFTIAKEPKSYDTEVPELREPKSGLSYKQSSGDVLVVVRATFGTPAADRDSIFRLPVAAARLVIGDKTFYPIGSMESKTQLGLSRPDDMLFVPTGSGVDLVYALPKSAADRLEKKGADDEPRFVEFKLFGRVDLSALTTDTYAGPTKAIKVIRKPASPLMLAVKPPAKPAS